MKILFVLEHFYPYIGGAEELFRNLTRALVKNGFEVDVVTTRYDPSLPLQSNYDGVVVHRVNVSNRYLFTLRSFPKVFKLAKEADIIHTTSYNAAFSASVSAYFRKKKIVITFHEIWDKLWFDLPFTPRWVLKGYYLFEQFILRLPYDKFIAVSDFTRKKLMSHNINPEKIDFIYNGLDYDQFANYKYNPPAEFTYCFFSRLGISKGIDILLEATKIFVERYPGVILKLIIPTYPEKLYKQVIDLIDNLQISANIKMLHDLNKEDLFQEICNSSCVVIPSHSEGFCFTAVESVGLGVPVLSSDKGALSEVVSGKHIKLKELTINSLVESLIRAYKLDWDELPVKHYNLEDSVQSYLKMYANLLS